MHDTTIFNVCTELFVLLVRALYPVLFFIDILLYVLGQKFWNALENVRI